MSAPPFLPSSTLQNTVKNLIDKVVIYDREKIESVLTESGNINLIKRYFPNSYKKISNDKFTPSNILSKYMPLSCNCCKKDLLTPEKHNLGIIVFVTDYKKNLIEDIYWSCKGPCDRELDKSYTQTGKYLTSWEDISDILIPSKYISWICAILNRMREGEDVYTNIAFDKLKEFLICISQLVFKNQSDEELERMKTLMFLPNI